MHEALAVIRSISLSEFDARIRDLEQELLAWKTLRAIKRAIDQPKLTDVQLFDAVRCVQEGLGEHRPPRARSIGTQAVNA